MEAARAEEERIMEEDAQSWLNKGQLDEEKDPKTGEYCVKCLAVGPEKSKCKKSFLLFLHKCYQGTN